MTIREIWDWILGGSVEKTDTQESSGSGLHSHVVMAPITLSELQAAAPVGSCWHHVKKGTTYHVTGYATLEITWELGVLYLPVEEGHADVPIARAAREFLDGRFIPWQLPQSLPSSPS